MQRKARLVQTSIGIQDCLAYGPLVVCLSFTLSFLTHPHRTQAAQSGVVAQVKPQEILPFCATHYKTGFCVGVSHYRSMRLCQK